MNFPASWRDAYADVYSERGDLISLGDWSDAKLLRVPARAACEDRLRHGKPANCALEPVEIEPAKLNNGESITDAIERLRRRGRELRADLHRIASAPYPSSYAKQRMRAIVEALAQEGTPDVASLIEHDRVIGWPQARLTSQVYNVPNAQGAVAFGQFIAVGPLMAWLLRDLLIKKLDAEIDSESEDASALTHEQRQQQEAEVLSDLLDIERQEAALVWLAQSQGLPVEHRADISPLALLGVALVTAAARGP